MTAEERSGSKELGASSEGGSYDRSHDPTCRQLAEQIENEKLKEGVRNLVMKAGNLCAVQVPSPQHIRELRDALKPFIQPRRSPDILR